MDRKQYVLNLKKLKSILVESNANDELDKIMSKYSTVSSKFLNSISDFFNNPSNEEKFAREFDRIISKEVGNILKFFGHNYIDSLTAYAKNTLQADNFTSFKVYMKILQKANTTLEHNDFRGPANLDYQAIRSGFIIIGLAFICLAYAIASCRESIRLDEITNSIKNLDIKRIILLLMKISYLGLCVFIASIGLSYIVIAIKNFDLQDETWSNLVEITYNGLISKAIRKLISLGIVLLNGLLKLSVSAYTETAY